MGFLYCYIDGPKGMTPIAFESKAFSSNPSSIAALLAEVEGSDAFAIIGALEYLWMSEGAYRVIVTAPPVLLHRSTRKLVVL